ncbi:MAG: phosphoribosyltransferase family protein [Patescibacteria group bacterium]
MECGKQGDYLCKECLLHSKKQWPCCPNCQKLSPLGQTHDNCKTKLGLDGLISVYCYGGVIKKAIFAVKYQYAYKLSDNIAAIVGQDLNNLDLFSSPVLIPVPLYRKRENLRGFNQTEEIGKRLASRLNWGFEKDIVMRIKHSKPQVGLSHQQRLRNISGEFAVNMEYLASIPELKSKTIIVFDDVWTTGATIKEVCKTLKENGFKKVWGLTIAR